MTIRQWHAARRQAALAGWTAHRESCHDDTETCDTCNNIVAAIDHHDAAIKAIDAGMRAFGIAR